ncbi:MAG: hypothetical protein KDE23_02640, partial [Caldilinea sp.]|nr:hypothetical protein [Caldilinea sp.]
MTSRKVDSVGSGAALLPLLHLAGMPTWEMPHLTSLNRLPPRATLIPYPSAGDALQRPREESPWFHLLNGVWDFKIFGRPEQVTHAAVAQGAWSPIAVPGDWTVQGYGRPHYTNVQMP